MQFDDKHFSYWRKNQIVIAALLLIWFIATFGASYFAHFLCSNFFG